MTDNTPPSLSDKSDKSDNSDNTPELAQTEPAQTAPAQADTASADTAAVDTGKSEPDNVVAMDTGESSSASHQQYDFILFGATSFVGKIMAEYLAENYHSEQLNWALAGRSQQKLQQLKNELGSAAANLAIVVADSANPDSLQAMCNSTQLIVSTVGPYALYGEPLVKACAETGTDYCDLTGETQWIARMLAKYQHTAEQSGARLVNCCGFDSIPSDLGVLFMQEQAKQQFDEYCFRVKMRVKAVSGGFSGGTAASLLNVVKEASNNPSLRRELGDPYILCPDGHPFFAHQSSNNTAKKDLDFKRWIAPFVMAAINTRIVHRSNALLDNRYGNTFLYDEAMLMKNKWVAKTTALGLGLFMVGAAFSGTRTLMEKLVLPGPGEGPSKDEQQNGFFNLHFFGETASGKRIKAKVTGDRDPGYGSTAKMLAETAIFFTQMPRGDKTQVKGGFWTPASLFGLPLTERLQEKAGLTFELLEQ